MQIYIHGVKWLISIISAGIQVRHMTRAKPLFFGKTRDQNTKTV